MFMYQLKMKRRISEESIKRAIDSWKATILSRPSSSGRGVKRERIIDEEEDAEEEEERLISMDRKRYTGEPFPPCLVCGLTDRAYIARYSRRASVQEAQYPMEDTISCPTLLKRSNPRVSNERRMVYQYVAIVALRSESRAREAEGIYARTQAGGVHER